MRGSPSRVEVDWVMRRPRTAIQPETGQSLRVYGIYTWGDEAQKGGWVANVAASMVNQALSGHCCRAVSERNEAHLKSAGYLGICNIRSRKLGRASAQSFLWA